MKEGAICYSFFPRLFATSLSIRQLTGEEMEGVRMFRIHGHWNIHAASFSWPRKLDEIRYKPIQFMHHNS